MESVITVARQSKRQRLNDYEGPGARPEEQDGFSDHLSDSRSLRSRSEKGLVGHAPGSQTSQTYQMRNEETSGAKYIISDDTQCCFGMLCGIPIDPKMGMSPTTSHPPLIFHPPNALSQDSDPDIIFSISSPVSSEMVCDLNVVAEIDLQFYYTTSYEQVSRRKGHPTWLLYIIIYGPTSIGDSVGQLLSRHRMYLQDPIGCDRVVPYRNPHAIELLTAQYTEKSDSSPIKLVVERSDVGPDLLSQLMLDGPVRLETEPPESVSTPLLRHQKQALSFMLSREQGWDTDMAHHDIWSTINNTLGRSSYRNNVTGKMQIERPPTFKGGLLADDMDLGKTLSMISLIASDQANRTIVASEIENQVSDPTSSSSISNTLVVVPLALLQVWQKQISLHLHSGSLKVHVYHGKGKKDPRVLKEYDIVLTTYHTIASIWGSLKHGSVLKHDSVPASIFNMTWDRVILDEGHIIRSMDTVMVCALSADCVITALIRTVKGK
ncbi:SNF2 family N-terminal domain-containing protein, partial [Rhexocercosporidium sp. MPI-PUGE-AT-0058]